MPFPLVHSKQNNKNRSTYVDNKIW